jgi:hypothetical protein
VSKAYSQPGLQVLRKILKIIPEVYKVTPPDKHQKKIVIFKALNDSSRPLSEAGAKKITDLRELPQCARNGFVLQCCDGFFLLWVSSDRIDVSQLAKDSIVYTYELCKEYFFAKDEIKEIRKILLNWPSIFCVPSFSNLNDALEDYRMRRARMSSCLFFVEAWADKSRLFLKNGPESKMRGSLAQFLDDTLRDAEVREEQNTDATHPVDIKVTWSFNRLALIEIKWLGDSKTDEGHVTAKYRDARANEGAKQLADYMDNNKVQAPIHTSVGYLVVIDGRRQGLTPETTTINRDAGFFYENKEIEYNPKYHEIRDDFKLPIRMFVEPIYLNDK